MSGKGFRIIILIAAAFLLYGILGGMRACTSVLASSLNEWTGMSYGTVSVAFSVMNIVLAVSGPLFGILTMKIRPAKIMIAGAVLGAAGFIGAAFSTSLPALIIFIGVFFGLGAAALCYSIVYAAAVPVIGEKYSIVFGGILTASMGAFGMILSPVFELGSEAFGVQACLIGVGILSLCLVPLCFLFLRKKETAVSEVKREPLFKSLKFSVTLPFFLMGAVGMFTLGVCDGGMLNHLFEFTHMYGAAETISALMVSVYTCAYTVGAVFGGIICSRIQNRKGMFGIIYLCWGILSIIGYLLPVGYATGFVIYSLCGIGVGMSVPVISAIVLDQVSLTKFAAIFSLLFFFVPLAYSLDSIAGGLLFDLSGNFLLIDIIAIGFAFITAVLFIVSGMKEKKKRKESENL